MTDKYIFYEFDGERYKVPTDKQQDFESKAPNAKIMLTLDGENYKVPLTELNTFISKAGGAKNLTYSSFDDKKQYSPNTSTEKLFSFEEPVAPVLAEEPKPIKAATPMIDTHSELADDDKVTWGETLKNSIGSLATRVGRKLWDSAVVNASRGVYIDPKTGEATRLDSVDEMIDNNHYAIEISKNMKEKADRLAKAADPTKGEQGYGELLKEGKLGTMVQKGLGDAIQSLDATAMGNNYLTMIPYVLASSSSNYIDQALENPDAPEWKRGAYALGTAAFEQFVEKFENPFAGKKVVGEITEKAAKEFIEKGTKEGVKAVADRIFNVLKRVGKGAGGEGLEEVVTSFGTDAIGEALDVIDGDKDYGIRAQWEQLKAQNPDASLKDFAKAKAGEYFDSFLGGAISGGWMSGPTQVAREAAESINDKVVKGRMQRTREMGSDLDLAHMYDVDDDVRSVTEEVANSFASEDGTQGISSEFIESLTAEDAYTLSRREDMPAAQRTALEHLAITKSMQEGLNDKLDQRLETEINANKALMEHVTENGKIISGQLRGRLVYIMGGAVNNGKVTIYSGHEGPVIAYDALTGEAETVGSKYITDAVSNDAADVISIMENSLRTMDASDRERWRTTMSPRAKVKAILPFAKKNILVDVGNGLTEVYVRQINSDGSVMIEGKKGDLGGQSILTLDATTFYDSIYRDNDGNPVVTEVEPQTEGAIENEPTEEPTEEPVAPTELTGEEDFRGYEGKIFIGGRLVDVIDAQQDNPSNTVNYTYLDENGNERVGTTTIGEFAAAIQQAQEQNVEPAPIVSPEPQPEPQPAPKDDVVATPIPTESIDWDALLDNDAEAYFSELQNRFGDKAERRLNAMITATENRLNKLNKENPQDPEEVFANDELKEKLENRLEVLRGLAARFAPVAEPTPVEPTTAEPVPVEPTTPAAPVEAPITEAPTEGKSENGFEFNEHNVCTNPEVISVPPVKKGWAVMNEVRLAEFNGKWGSAIDAHTGTGGVGIPLTKSDCKFDTKEEAIADAYNALVRFRASRDKDTGLKDLDNLIKHLEKEYPFVKEAATPAPTTPVPSPTEPAPAEPSDIVLDNGYIVMDGKIVNPDVIEMPDNKNKIYFAEKDGKWGYGYHAVTDDNNESWNDTIQLEMLRYDSKEDAIKGALSYFNTYKDIKKNSPSTGIDAFLDYVRNTYFPNEVPTTEPTVTPEPQPAPAPKPTATPKPKPIGQVEQQRGNAIKRLFEEFKANAAKISKKIGMNDFVGTDKTRPVMTGVHREGGFEYATDSHILAKIQTKYPSDQEGKTFSLKTGEEISGKYPKVSDIVESHMKNARLVSANVDDILAYSQLLEEIKKGLSNTNLYVKVGDRIFKSDILLKAAKMAKLHGLSDIYMRDDSRAPIIFVGSKGAIIAMPYQLNAGDQNVLDIDTGEIVFSDYTMLKSPTTLKGIEAAKLSLEAILPKIGNGFIDNAKNGGWLRLVDGKVKFDFPTDEIVAAKNKAKDPNTYNAINDIEKNGLEIPLSDEEIAKIFPELVNDSHGNSVPLGNEPTGENNGSKGEAPQGENTQGYPNDPNSGRGNNTGNQGASQGGSQTTSGSGSEGQGGKEGQSVEDRYPARKGNATGKTLVDTFGFKNVAIPDSRKSILNSIYDFMMGMAKVLGISPKSIGNGGTLGLGNLRANSTSNARYQYRYYYSGEVYNAHMDFRYDRLMSVAHEWWHALDHVLMFFDSGKGLRYTTSVSESEFAGRKETYDAVNAVLKAIKDSGHPTRVRSLGYDYKYTSYLLKPTELVARAFDEYIKAKFEEAGIQVEGTDYEEAVRKPNAEEMAVIAPAIENLFKVLKEKEGKEAGTSVLYQIGEQMDNNSYAKQLATEALALMLNENDGINLNEATDEQVSQMMDASGANPDAEFMVAPDKPVFVSNAAVAVEAIKQEKATPEQWLKMIEKNGGLKAGEDKWMGLSDWLKASDKKTLTKQEVLNFINDNTIQIEEVNYVAQIELEEEEQKQLDAMNEEFLALREQAQDAGEWIADAGEIAYQLMADKYGDDFTIGFGVDNGKLYVSNLEAAASITGIEPRSEREINDTRLQYTTEGLDNKKEIALVVPTIEPWNQHDEIHFGDAGDGRVVAWVRFGDARTYAKEYADFYDFQGKMQKKYFPDRTIQALGGSDLDALTEEERAEFERLREIARSIPAKNRTNRRVLVIDEIQSKRHQTGRDEGYQNRSAYDKAVAELDARSDELLKRRRALIDTLTKKYGDSLFNYLKEVRDGWGIKMVPNEDIMTPEEVNEYLETSQEPLTYELMELKKKYLKGVPDAPFDKNWSELAMKRMLRYAAENGYDAVAWTKGEQQADRYSMTKHFTSIEREDNPSINGRRFQFYGGNVETFIVDENGIVADSTISEAKGKPLADVVGKDLSVKMMSIEDGDTLDDQAIAVGGEGMKGFYDKMLPAFMNKYGKKWGVKVSDITLPHVEGAGRVMHSVPVNDAMRESVMEGQPMFMKRPNGTVYGWAIGNNIYYTKAGFNPNTLTHEYTHLWAKAMMLRNPKGWKSVKDLLRGTPVWNEVLNDVNYSSIHSNEDLVASEVLSRISGAENAHKLEMMAQEMIDNAKGTMRKAEARGLIQNIKDALNKFWNWVGTELFGIEKFDSIEQVTDRVLWDLINKTNLGNLEVEQAELSKKKKASNYKTISADEYAVVAESLSKRFGHKNVFGCIGYTSNYFYLCDYFEGETKIRSIFEIDADEATRQYIENYARQRDGFTEESFIAGLDSSGSGVSGKVWDFDGTQDEGTSVGDGMVDSSEHQDEAKSGRDNESVREDNWITVKTGYDGSKFARIRFVNESDLDYFPRRSDIQNAAVDYNVGETRDGIIERAVSEEAQKLGVNVTFAKRSEMAKGHETDKGYYNTKTGEIVICPENNASIADAIQTILHEAVAHKGLRQLMGERFNEFISRVYDSLDANTKAEVDELAEDHYNGNTAVAMEEYMASLAEREDFNDNTIWDKIKNFFTDLINRILDRDDIVIGDNELRYILRASYNNMVNPRGMETVRGWAKDQTMREEYKINEATPELLSRTGIDPTEVSRETARSTYDRVVADSWQEFQRQFQDAMQPVRIAIDAIQQETGNIPIEDYENYILIQNHASSRSRVEIDEFVYKHYKPLIAKVNEVVSKIIEARGGNIKSEKERAYAYQELKVYLIAKHGLERNKYYQSTNTRKLNPYEKQKETEKVTKEFEEKVNNINLDDTLNDTEKELAIRNAEVELAAAITEINERMVPDLRDYSGLTSLFGYSPRKWEKAEEEAQLKVEEMEALIGEDVVNALWGKINAATNKTLRHSYESGLLSRQQYEDISKMFKFYIPLRGFDETTAEDVYSYARFEGNRFNPAVQTAKGRTSVADDPIAIIMNMAESEIAQGNKNRAKQALYNFLLNRSAGQSDQNSLMQIESVWYTIEVDESGKETYTIAAPNHESGETYEEFESRMLALEAENKAAKSKKGKVNIGKRFQKQMNRNSHYVYLKVNGVEKAIYINGNPKAADAINGTYMPKPNEFTNKWRDINRLISSTFTNYSLGFTARNFVRDALYSRINIAIKESNPEYRKKFRQNWWHAFGSMRKLINAFRNGELDRPDLTEDEAMFVEFMRNGGQTGYTVINSVEAHKKDLEKAIKRMQKGIEHGGVKDTTAFKVLVGWIEVMNEASELLTRYTAYKTSRDLGRGIEKSVGDAKEISVNFNTRGAQDGTGGFGWFARYFGLTKYFFNASVQGVQNIGAMAQANKLKFCKVAGGIMAAGVVTPLVTGFIASIFGGDDDEEYWNIPEYDRQNNICIQMGGSYVKIPLPIGFRELYAIGDMVAAIAFDKKFDRDFVQVGTDMANKIASIVLPINPLESTANGLSLWDTMLYTALPSTLQFWVQNATNTDWKGAPLQKEYTYNEDDPQWMKAFNSNPKWMRCLSKWCNENINPDGDFDGWDWSPEKLDNTLSNLFGGVYTMVKQGGRTISTIISEDKDFRAASIPLVGVLLDTGINDDDRFVTDAYFDMKEYYDANVNSIKRTAKAFGYSLEEVFGDEPVGIHHPKMQKIYKNRNFDWMQEWYKGDKEIKSLSDKIKRREKKLAGMEEPSVELVEEITNLKNEHTTKRRDFVNDMLELD